MSRIDQRLTTLEQQFQSDPNMLPARVWALLPALTEADLQRLREEREQVLDKMTDEELWNHIETLLQ